MCSGWVYPLYYYYYSLEKGKHENIDAFFVLNFSPSLSLAPLTLSLNIDSNPFFFSFS